MKKSPFMAAQPAGLRLWHWLNALAILGLLGTVYLRKTVLSWRINSVFIETRLREAGTAVEPKLAESIAKGLRDAMWEWHIALGVALSALLLLRIAVAIVTRTFAAKAAIEAFSAASKASGAGKRELLHFAVVRTSYALFYLLLVFMVVSGLQLTYGDSLLPLSKEAMRAVKETHELAMWFMVAFVGLHLAGVVVAELSGKRGIVSNMINGGDDPER